MTNGTTLVNVHVGSGLDMQIFSIHKSLLCAASGYFISALGDIEDCSMQVLGLIHDSPMAFEVLHQWLCSGVVHCASFYTQSRIADDVLWLRMSKPVNARLVEKLQDIAYNRLRDVFNRQITVVPSVQFIEEL